jgi:hypothetical protein
MRKKRTIVRMITTNKKTWVKELIFTVIVAVAFGFAISYLLSGWAREAVQTPGTTSEVEWRANP